MLCLGKVQGTGCSANIKGSICQSERKSIWVCIESVLGHASETWAESGGYGRIGETGTNEHHTST